MLTVKHQLKKFEFDIEESNNVSRGLWINIDVPVNLKIELELSDLKLYKVDNPVL